MLSSAYIIVLCSSVLLFHRNVNVLSCVYETPCAYTSLPEQIRVSILEANTVTIAWRTNGTLNGSNDTLIPQVEYSTDFNMSNSIIVNGTSDTYTRLGNVSWFHSCILKVNFSTTYYYHILESLCVNKSEKLSFTSQPLSGNATSINMNIFGDLGFDNQFNEYQAHYTYEALIDAVNDTDIFFHVGDMAYADDFVLAPKDQKNYEFLWNSFQKKLEPLTSHRFYMTAPGNHEVTCQQPTDQLCSDDISKQYRNFSAYMHRFSMPGKISEGSYRNLWYSFDYGLAHFVIINTETDFTQAPSGPGKALNGGDFAEPGAQQKWLERDLIKANLNRDTVPWIIVFGHRPFFGSISVYSSVNNDSNCDACRIAFADIIYDQGVDFYFNGHVHYYERLYPVNRNGTLLTKNYTEPAGPIYITTGGAGAPEPLDRVFVNASATANYIYDFGYTRLEIKNSSYCELSFFKAQAKEKVDLVQITRTHHKVPPCSS